MADSTDNWPPVTATELRASGFVADDHEQCGRSVAAAYRTGLADARRQILEWADDQMQALPEHRTPVAHGKAEVLRDLRDRLSGNRNTPASTPEEGTR